MTATDVQNALDARATPEKAQSSAWFFKTGPGQYGEGDQFIGVTVPEQRKVARQFRELPISEVEKLLASPIHEHRFTALEILVFKYQAAQNIGEPERPIVDFYLTHLTSVNNWDLVDTSAPYLLGDWVLGHRDDEQILTVLAKSGDLWSERIAIVATAAFIKAGRFGPTLTLAERFLTHRHDLMHKATGWMLREVGKRDQAVLTQFLDAHAVAMPRTMLRYTIEKFSVSVRQRYLDMKRDTRTEH